jgi:uncharacterized protein YfaS (alpha-2-macroglobulin family)
MKNSPNTWIRWPLLLVLGFGALLAVAEVATPRKGLTVESLGSQDRNGRPTVAVRFSQALDPQQAFDTLASVRTPEGGAVEGSWALDHDGRTLVFPFLQARSAYQVRIAAELRAADGSTLGSVFDSQVRTTALPAEARFMSNGSVVPRHGHQGLPVVSTNVESVDVEFLRVRPEDHAAFFLGYPTEYSRWPGVRRQAKRAGGDVSGEHDWKSELERVADLSESVYQQRYTLAHPGDQRALTYLPVHRIPELREPGVYMAVMKQPNQFPNTWPTAFFFVTDLGLHARRYGDRVWVHAASLRSGKPLEGARVRAQGELGHALGEATTDAQGNAWLDVQPQGAVVNERGRVEDSAELLLLSAVHERDVALLPFNQPALDLSALPIVGRKQQPYDVYAWGSRDLYRPGEQVRVNLLLRDHDGRLSATLKTLFVELLDPKGASLDKRALDALDGGYASYSFQLADGATTGLYKLRLSADGNTAEAPFAFDIHVEEFLPERLKIELTSAQATLAPGEALRVEASSMFLYGAPAGGKRFVASMVQTPAQHPVEALPDFHFGDDSARFDRTPTQVLDTVFDAQGRIVADVDLSAVPKDKGPIEVKLLGEVQESGGRAVNRVLKRVIWPAPVLLGIRPHFDDDRAPGDSTAKFDLVASDVAGMRHAVAGVRVRVLRDWRDYSWYYRDAGSFDVSVTSATTVVDEQVVDLAAAGRPFELSVPVKWGGYWVELIHPDSGVTARYHFSAGWSWGGDTEIAREPRPDQVQMALDKVAYRVGDTATLTLHAPYPGPGFVIVESDRQLFQMAIEAKPEAVIEIPIDERFVSHDIYVSAVVLRPDGSRDALLPSRAVGMQHLALDRSERSVTVQLDAPALTRPGQPMRMAISVPALSGQRAFVVLTAVDAGITNITRYEAPDPAGFFFGRRQYALDVYDVYGRIVENYAGERARLRYGGDGEAQPLPDMPRDKLEVELIDLHRGPLALDAQGRAQIEFPAPEFDGTLKLTALVFADDRFGRAQAEAVVRQPVVAQLSAPRALAPGDSATLAIDVRNLSGAKQAIGLKLQASGGIAFTDSPPASVELADGAGQTLLVGLRAHAIGPARVDASLRVRDGAVTRGVSTVVRPAWAPQRRIEQSTLDGPATMRPPASLVAGMLPGARLQFTVSNRPLLPLAGAAVEITEKHWWYSFLKLDVQRGHAHLLLDANARQRFGLGALAEDSRRALVQAAIDAALGAQTPLGHFRMWGKDSWVDTRMTPHIAEFWLSARAAGFVVDPSALDRTLSRLRQDLQNGGNAYMGYQDHQAIRFADNAYAAYVLGITRNAPIGTLRTLYNEHAKDAKTMLPLVHLALALRAMGDAPLAEQALAQALNGDWDSAWGIGDFGSAERDLAWTHALLHEHGLLTPAWEAKLLPLGRNLAARSREQRWKGSYLNIDESLALVRLGTRLLAEPGEPLKGHFVSGDTRTGIASARQFSAEFKASELTKTAATLESAGTLYIEWASVGFPRSAPPADQSQVAISREYFTLDGTPFTGNTLKQGERLLVHLSVQAERDIRDAVLVDLQPGGLEVENLHLGDFAELANIKIADRPVTGWDYGQVLRRQEYKDDRYVAAIDFSAWHGGQINLFYVVRAVTPGDYTVPPPFVEDMYRPQVRGQGVTVLERLVVE